MEQALEDDVRRRFGLVPNFFRLASAEPQITISLWGFAQFAYLDNPLPSLFKERLFVYLSRFCDVRYCVARHLGFLVGLGYPAGDSRCVPQTIEATLPLLRRPLPTEDEMLPLFNVCAHLDSPLASFPTPDCLNEQALIACAAHVFIQTSAAAGAREALRLALGPINIEYLNVLLAFVRTAHYWTKLHPELQFEDDIIRLLSRQEELAQCVLKDPALPIESLSKQVMENLEYLKGRR